MRNAMLAGERIYLRPLEPDDAQVIANIEAGENETITHMGGRTPYSQIGYRRAISEGYKTLPPANIEFAVCRIEDDEMIGLVGLVGINWVHGHAETFSSFRPGEFRGRGFGTEAKHLLLEYSFERIGLHVLTSWVWELNERSAGALAKQGYKPAGRMLDDGIEKGVYHDDLVFDILREDWLEARDAWRAAGRRSG